LQKHRYESASRKAEPVRSRYRRYSPDERNVNTLYLCLRPGNIRGVFYAAEQIPDQQNKKKGIKKMYENLNTQKKTVKLAKMGMLVAISVVLVYLIHFPIFPAVPFLEYDPADIPIFIGTFAFGPLGGLAITVVTAVVQGTTVSAASGVYGILMHVIATGSFVLVAGIIYKRNKTRKGAVIALAAGSLTWIVAMFFANLIITPYFMGVPRAVVMDLMPFIVAFNAIKAGGNSLITFLLYKRISAFLHK